MKTKTFKSSIFIMLIMSICLAFSVSASAKTEVSGDFTFDITSSGATLVKYTGQDENVEIPAKVNSAKVTAIGLEAFFENKTLKSVTIPSGVKTIGDGAFWCCSSLKSVAIPETVTEIGYAAFNECSSLEQVILSSGVKTIGESAFWYCTSLKTVVVPESVTKIGKNAFKGCDQLTVYTVKGSYGETYIKSLDYVKLAYRYATAIKLNATSLTLSAGATKTLIPELSPTPLYNDAVTYKSSDSKIATVDTSGNITAVSAGKTTITVKAKDGSGKKATCTVTVKPAKPTSLKAGKLTAASAEIKWEKAAGATGYKIYKYNPSTKKYVSLATTSKCTYTDKTAKIGETVKYKIKAYAKSGSTTYYSSYSSVLTVNMPTPGTVSKLTAAASTTYVKFTWAKADTATGYRVYQYSPSKKAFVKKVSTSSLKATIKKLKANTEYTFAVQAFYKDSKGNVTFAKQQQEITVNTRPAAPKSLTYIKGSESFDRVSVKWTGVSGVTGYEIVCTPEKGNAVIKKVTGASANSCVVDSLSFGTTYEIKIRAYTERKSGTAYSYYSNTVKATTIAMPSSPDEAFASFITAYNDTKKFSGNAAIYKNTEILDFKGDNADKYEGVRVNAFRADTDITVFENGKDKNGNTVSAYMAPFNADCVLTADKLLPGSLSYKGNGSGYEISFTLPEDTTGETAGLIAPLIDIAAIEKSTENFSLTSCRYTAVRVTAKVQGGLISHMDISQDVEVSFKIGVRSYSFTQTVVTTYAVTEL